MHDRDTWQYAVRQNGDTAEITLEGDVDLVGAPALQELFDELLQSGQNVAVRVDLSGVSFLDSTVLSALISGYQTALIARRRFVVVNPSKPAQRLLSVTGLGELLTGR